jgi:hypothetical protein
MIVAIRRAIACSWRAWHESAWGSVHRENRPVGYGMIGSRYARRRQTESDRTPGTKALAYRRASHQVSAYPVETLG